MPRTPLRALGALAVIAGAGILTTCTTDSSGPGRRGAFAVEPVLPPMLHLSAFNLTVDNVRLTVVRPPGETVYDTIVAFPANQSSLQLSADIPLDQSPESFDVTIQMLYGSQLLFSGTQSVLVSEGSNSTPAQIPLTYAGPGQNIATLSIDPPDSLLTWDGTLAFRTTALDAQQSPVTSYYLSWSTNDATVPIDATGQLAAPHFRKTVTVTATTPTNISASTTLTLLPAPSAITVTSGCGQTAAPGSQLPQPVVAKVIAADNGGVQGVTVTFTPPSGGTAVPAQVVTDANGLAQTTVTLAPTAGPQLFAISAPGLSSFPCSQTAAGVATHLAFTTEPSNVAVGSPITPAVVVTALDALGNPATSFTGNVTIAIGSNPGNATLGGSVTLAAVAGVATFNNLTLNQLGTGYTLSAAATGLPSATSAAFNVVNTGGTHLVFTTQPSNVVAGSVITPAIVVTAEDVLNNPVTSFTANVTLSFGTCPVGATLSGTATVASSAGVATFNDISIDKAGGCTLVASSPSLQGVASSSFTINAGAKAKLAFSVEPSTVVAGAVISPVVAVAIEDALGNTVPTATDNVTVAIGTNPGSATLGGTATKAAASGVALFTDLTLNKTGTGYTLTAASGSLTGATSTTFNVSAGAAATVVKISGDGQTGAGGAALAQPLIVEVRDALANPVPGVTVNWATPSGGSLAPPSGPTGVNGQAQATWTLGASAPSQTATATVGALTPASFSATASIGTPAISLSFAGIPGVGVGLTAKVYVDLNQAAPAGGTAVTVASGNASIFTVLPAALTVPQGKTRDSVTVTGVAAGTDTLTATASGFTAGKLAVLVQNRNISVPPTLNVPYGQTASLPIQLPAPAPAGGVSFTVLSSAPGFVSVASSPVTIAAGGQTVNATLNGVLPGPATITVSNPAYVDGTTSAATTASLNIVQTSASLNASFGTSITINFESNGSATAAPAPGISVTLTPSDPTCLAVTSPVSIATGLVNATAALTYGASATLPCTTKLLAQANNLLPDSINVTVNPVPGITVNAATVGSGLQIGASGNLGASNHGGVNVTLTSRNPNVLLSTSPSVAGSGSISVFVPNNQTGFNYTVQALEGQTGTTPVQVVATAPGFTSDSGTISLVQGAIDLIGVPANTTTLSATNNIYARTGIPNSQTAPAFLTQLEAVRAGAPSALTVTFTSQTPTVGDLVKAGPVAGATQTATIPALNSNSPTDTTSGGVLFRPLATGSTTVSANITGFLQVTSATGTTVNVTQPPITVNAATVGSGLQIGASGNLGASNHGGVNVTLTSRNPNVLLSTSPSVAGSGSISVFVPNNQTGFNYTVQALEGQTGTTPVQVVATAPGFASDSGTISLVQGAIDLIGVPTNTTTLSPTNNIYARTGIPNSQSTPSFLTQLQVVRAGAPAALTVTFTSQTPAVGDLVKAGPVAGATQTATIPLLGDNTPTDTTTGGVLFRPLLSGGTVVSAGITGFLQVTSAAGSPVTVTQPGITVNPVTVGSGLQVVTSGTLGASNHGGTTVTITSSNAAVLLAPDATTPGTSSITLFVANNFTGFNYYVQGLEGHVDTVTATITATGSGFTDGIGTATVVPPAFDVIGLPATPASGSADVPFYVRVGIANGTFTFLTQLQAVRAGAPGPLTATATSNAAPIGTLVVTSGTGASQQVQIPVLQTNSPTSVATGGVAFRPVAPGQVIITTTIPGFTGTTSAATTIIVQ